MHFEKRVKTVSVSLPKPWCDRLDAIVVEGERKNLNITRSNLILQTLQKNHRILQQVEASLGMTVMELDELK